MSQGIILFGKTMSFVFYIQMKRKSVGCCKRKIKEETNVRIHIENTERINANIAATRCAALTLRVRVHPWGS
jgi:hypothetical protein